MDHVDTVNTEMRRFPLDYGLIMGKSPLGQRRALSKAPGAFHHGDLRRALLSGAELLLDRGGMPSVSLRAAARLAGVSQTAPYRHFRDKEALLAALAEEVLRGLRVRLASAARQAPEPRAALRALAEAYVTFAVERPHAFRLVFGPEVANEERCPGVHAAGREAFQALLGAVAAAQRAGVLRQGPPGVIGLAFWASVHGAASLIVDGRLPESVAAAGGPGALARAIVAQLEVTESAPP